MGSEEKKISKGVVLQFNEKIFGESRDEKNTLEFARKIEFTACLVRWFRLSVKPHNNRNWHLPERSWCAIIRYRIRETLTTSVVKNIVFISGGVSSSFSSAKMFSVQPNRNKIAFFTNIKLYQLRITVYVCRQYYGLLYRGNCRHRYCTVKCSAARVTYMVP